MMNSKQFAWLYLIENGMAGRKPSYYGGSDIVDSRLKDKKYADWLKGGEASREFYIEEIKQYGINWNKTDAPFSDSVSQFTDTFHDPKYNEFLFGQLVLNNGTIQNWCGEMIEVTNVFDMMAAIDAAKARADELFVDV